MLGVGLGCRGLGVGCRGGAALRRRAEDKRYRAVHFFSPNPLHPTPYTLHQMRVVVRGLIHAKTAYPAKLQGQGDET